jgi:VWFA-related protein
MLFGKGVTSKVAGRVAAAAATAAVGSALCAVAWSQQAQQNQVPDAPSSVPSAPRPSVLPRLNSITPVSQLPDAPPPPLKAKPEAAAADGQQPVGDSLDKAPVPEPETHPDDGQAPDMSQQDVNSVYRLGTVNVQFVEVPFTVKDSKRRLVPGLTWRDIRVYENGLRQQMRFFTTDPKPLSVSFLIDQGVTQDTMEKINGSLNALQGAFSPYDEVAVFTYSTGQATKQTTFTAAQSARLGAVLERSKASGREALMPMGGPLSTPGTINNKAIDPNFNRGEMNAMQLNPPKEYHPLFDAILDAAKETTQAGRDRRRIVYIISDGKEYGSKTKEKELIKYLQANNVEVYATLVGDSSIPGMGFLDRVHLPFTMRDDALPRIVSATGGQTDPEFRLRGIESSFAKITEEVRTQYTVGYYTHESPLNEKFRRVEIRVLRPGLTIISEDGYYPNARDSRPRTTGTAATKSAPAPANQMPAAANP